MLFAEGGEFGGCGGAIGQLIRRGTKTIADALCDARDGSVNPVITGQYRSGDVRHIVADPARAAEALGFRAAVDPRQGLREFAFAPLR